MRRRDFLNTFAFGAILTPPAARAQQRRMPVIGYLSGGSASFYASILPGFREGLSESGYVESQNVKIEYR